MEIAYVDVAKSLEQDDTLSDEALRCRTEVEARTPRERVHNVFLCRALGVGGKIAQRVLGIEVTVSKKVPEHLGTWHSQRFDMQLDNLDPQEFSR